MVVFTIMRRSLATSARTGAGAALLWLVVASNLHAQQVPEPDTLQPQKAKLCADALQKRGVERFAKAYPCQNLANQIVTKVSDNALLRPSDVQPSGAGNASPAGTAAQSTAVPTVQPTPFASAVLAAAAQDSGSTAITALSINPAMLFSSPDNTNDIARLARLLDVTLFLPLNRLDANKDGTVDYAGMRVRMNFTAASQASTLQRLARARFTELVSAEEGMAEQLHRLLLNAANPDSCATLLTTENAATTDIQSQCGAQFDTRLDPALFSKLREAATAAREEADAKYLGLDLRLDTGDPSFGKIHNAAGNSFLAALGFGRRFNPTAKGTSGGMRGRLGVRYANLRDTTAVDWQLDGGLALESSRLIGAQRLELSGGVEFRYSGNRTASEALQTRFGEFRGGITVPLTGSTAISISGSAPLWGDRSPSLSVSGNWQQLLGALMPSR